MSSVPPLYEGDMVLFHYDLLVDGVLKETTDEKKAGDKKFMLRNTKGVLVTVGVGQLVLGLEEHLREHADESLNEGGEAGRQEMRVVIPPKKAFGEREAAHLHHVPFAKFGKERPQVGQQVQIGNRPGIVTKLNGGRATVDANHEFAGREVEYVYTVHGVFRSSRDKIAAMLRHSMGKDVVFHWDDDLTLTIETPEVVLRHPQWPGSRGRLLDQLRFAADGQRITVTFIETFGPPPLPPPVTIEPDPAPPADPVAEEQPASEPATPTQEAAAPTG